VALPPPRQLTFTVGAATEVEAAMRELATSGGWMNLHPLVDEGDLPPIQTGLLSLLSPKTPALPVGTWVPGGSGRKGPEPDELGVSHPRRRKMLVELAERGVTRPEGWVRKQDHATRGIVLALPHGTDPTPVLAWLTAAMSVLSPVDLDGTFRASFHAGVQRPH
jgi:hypothetical protein